MAPWQQSPWQLSLWQQFWHDDDMTILGGSFLPAAISVALLLAAGFFV